MLATADCSVRPADLLFAKALDPDWLRRSAWQSDFRSGSPSPLLEAPQLVYETAARHMTAATSAVARPTVGSPATPTVLL